MDFTVNVANEIEVIVDDRVVGRMVHFEDNGVKWIMYPDNLVHNNLSERGFGSRGVIIVSNELLSRARAQFAGM